MLKNIKIGIKIATKNLDFLPEIYSKCDIIDFIEIILLPDFNSKDIEIIKNLKIPYVIHIPNSNYGIDFGEIKQNSNNLNYIKKINQFKNELKPICYVIHPESGNLSLSIENLKKLSIKPLAIENMPLKSLIKGELLGSDVSGLKEYFNQIEDLELCLDINHAIKASISKNLDSFKLLREFFTLKKPIIFHISGGSLTKEIDEHLPFEESEYNLTEIKEFLFDYGEIVRLTFETPRNYKNVINDDIRNINIFLKA